MGIFDKKTCAGCGKEVGKISFTFKKDKQHLCKECVNKIDDLYLQEFVKKNWTGDYFKNTYLPFLKESEERSKIFKLKAWYGPLFIDEQNKMFLYSSYMRDYGHTEIPENTPIFKFDEISKESSIFLEQVEVKSGVFHDNVRINVNLNLFCPYPELVLEWPIKIDLSIKMKKKDCFLTLPEDIDRVRKLFHRLLGKEEKIPEGEHK